MTFFILKWRKVRDFVISSPVLSKHFQNDGNDVGKAAVTTMMVKILVKQNH